MADIAFLNLFKVLKMLWAFFSKRQRFFIKVLMVSLTIKSLMEMLFAIFIGLLLASVADPDIVMNSSAIVFMKAKGFGKYIPDAHELVLMLSICTMLLVLVKNLFHVLLIYSSAYFSASVDAMLGLRLMRLLYDAKYQWLLKKNTADLVLAFQWIRYLGRSSFLPIQMLMGDLFTTVALLSAALYVQPVVCMVIILVGAFVGALIFLYIKPRLDVFAVDSKNRRLASNRIATTSVHGIKDARIMGLKAYFSSLYGEQMHSLKALMGRIQIMQRLPWLFLETLAVVLLCSTVIYLYGDAQASLGEIAGTLALMAVASWKVLPAFGRILENLSRIRHLLPYMTSVSDLFHELEAYGDIPLKEGRHEQVNFTRKLEVHNLGFCYDNRDVSVLKGLHFVVKAGTVVGIVGSSGAGKSTLVDIIIGLLKPTEGAIQIDGKNLDETTLASWQSLVGYVPQHPYIMDATIAENIAFGLASKDIDYSRVQECCQLAAVDFIDDMEDGLDSMIGERGAMLSGGQRQRIAIARALYREPSVIIFDEATSSLDHANERAILETIYGFRENRTIILIAHRLETVKACDQIIWLKSGEVHMAGTPEKVLSAYGSNQ